MSKEKIMKEKTRAEAFGVEMADAVMNAAHLTYNASRGRMMISSCIRQLQARIEEIKPRKAKPSYRKARYG